MTIASLIELIAEVDLGLVQNYDGALCDNSLLLDAVNHYQK